MREKPDSMSSGHCIASSVFKALATDSRPWNLTRRLRSDNPLEIQGKLKGTATFKRSRNEGSSSQNDLVYEEQGEMLDLSGRNTTGMKWSRKYMRRLLDSDLSVWLVKANVKSRKESTQDRQAEGLPDYLFHQLQFTDEVAVRHQSLSRQ